MIFCLYGNGHVLSFFDQIQNSIKKVFVTLVAKGNLQHFPGCEVFSLVRSVFQRKLQSCMCLYIYQLPGLNTSRWEV